MYGRTAVRPNNKTLYAEVSMLYNLNEQQVKNLQLIVQNAPIKGADAPAIIELLHALSSPVNPDVAPTVKKDKPLIA